MTRIDIQTPSEVGETARVLHLANQRRLADRQAEGWAEREAERLAERARSFVGNPASKAAKDDPWRGAVPEFDPPPGVRARIPGKQFKIAGAYFQWRRDGAAPVSTGRLLIWTASKEHSVVINLPYAPRWYEALPAGGDRVVLLFYGYSATAEYDTDAHSTYEKVPGAPHAAADSDFTYLGYRDVPVSDGSGQVTIVHTLFTGADLRPYPDTYTETTTTGGRRFVKNTSFSDYKYSVVVSKQSIKVMASWPAGLEAILRQKYEIAEGIRIYTTSEAILTANILELAAWDVHWLTLTEIHGKTYQESKVVGSLGFNEDWEVTFTPNAYQVPTLLQFSTPGGPDIAGIYVWHPLMRSYGYGYLVNRDAAGQTPGWGRTPAVFSFLKNYTGEFHKEDGDTSMLTKASSYQHARDNYIPQDAPPYFLTTNVAIPEATVDTTKTYYYFRAPAYDIPLDYSNPLTFRTENSTIVPIALRPNRGEYTREVFQSSVPETQKHIETGGLWFVSEHEIPVAAWDWNRPLACWLELTRLGFTTDDLMLSDDEAKALAEADPATTAFKF
jgi:hypothetical protein